MLFRSLLYKFAQILWREDELNTGDMLMIAKNNYYWTEKMMDDCAEVICCVDKFGTMNAANRRLVEKAKRDGKLKTE